MTTHSSLPSTRRLPEHSKYPRLTARLRSEIIAGKWSPGQQLPTVAVLTRRFKTSKLTLLRCLATLQQAGFIRTEPGQGTFVAAHPPHLTRYALALPFKVTREVSQFYFAVRAVAAQRRDRDCRISIFHEIQEHVDTEDYQQLVGLVAAQRLAGLIFAHNPFLLGASPVIEQPGLARVAIMQPDSRFEFPTVYPAVEQFIPRAFEYAAIRRRKRVALAFLADGGAVDHSQYAPVAAAHGLTLHRRWLQSAAIETPQSLTSAIEAVFHRDQRERPDVLVITDDNLVPAATAGLQSAGVRVPEDVTVVAQTNFPYPTTSAVPVIRLGYDIPQLVAICLERLAQQQRGETGPAHTALPPFFEHELAANRISRVPAEVTI